MAAVKLNRAKHKAISGHLSDYFGFKLSDNGSVLFVENVCVRLVIKPSHITYLTLTTCTVRIESMRFYFLTKINY